MRFLIRTWTWLWPVQANFVELDQLQARLLRSLLVVATVLGLVLSARSALTPAIPMTPGLLLVGVVLACAVAQARWPRARPWVLRVLLLCSVAIVYRASFHWASAVAPPIVFLPLFGVLGTLIESPFTGNWVALASLLVLEALRQQFGFPQPTDLHFWSNLLLCLVFAHLIGLAFYHVFIRVQEQLNDQSQRLAQVDLERKALTQALLEGLRVPVQSLMQAVQRPVDEATAQIRAQVLNVADQLQAAAGLRHGMGEVDDLREATAGLHAIRRRFMMIMIYLALATLVLVTVRNLDTGGLVLVPVLASLALVALLFWLRGREVDPARVNRVLILFFVVLFVIGVRDQGLHGVPPSLPYLPNLVLSAALLSGLGLALGVVAVGTAVALAVWSWGTPTLQDTVTLGNITLTLVILAVVCRQVWELHEALLAQLQERADALAGALRQRRRLLGTLFHDINNPLMAIQAVLQLPKAGVPLTARDQERLQHMASRIRQLVDAAETFLLGDALVPPERLRRIDVAQLFAETQELFEARLRAKRQHLIFTSPPGLAVLALPEVLRDSIVSNLVSNALKFSPAATGLALEARVEGSQVVLTVRDSGAGVSDEVLASLVKGSPMVSSTGTGGEQGQGLGLGLVQEHLSRLGGRFELERLPGGGTEARAWLNRA